jgi:flavin-dependent dehydrogenase
MRDDHDILILGGGLAGLTLALQLKLRRPGLDVAVIERSRFPVPVAAHKVGESTVEIGAHYFAKVLGLERHLEEKQLLKFGLRFFFGGPSPGMDLAGYDEIGPSELLPVRSYQLDRGLFENHLAERARALGVELVDGSGVQQVELSDSGGTHCAVIRTDAGARSVRAGWIVDATGRRGVIKRELGLERATAHRNCAVWLRTAEPIDIGTWSEAEDWQARCGNWPRRLSTNHLMGPGYWVWFIPLGSGATSVGLVFDPALLSLARVAKLEGLLGWLDEHQPLAAAAVRARRDSIMDFRFLRGYPHGCRQVFSAHRWALTGEAGVFSDPFYSPGSDFIGIGNTLIVDLILGGASGLSARAHFFQQLYFSFFSSTLSLFTNQYPGFGDRDLMSLKSVWDYSYYWAVLAKLFFEQRLTDVAFLQSAEKDLLLALRLNREMQKSFETAAAHRRCLPAEGHFVDHCAVPWFYELKQQLVNDSGTSPGARLQDNVARLDRLAGSLRGLLAASFDGRLLPPASRIGSVEAGAA